MRKIKLLALALVIGTASVFAVTPDNPEKLRKEIRNQIVELLITPDFNIDQEVDVVLKFTFNSEGEIVVLCPGCKSKKLTNYIRKNLNNKKFTNPGVEGKIYKVPLKISAA